MVALAILMGEVSLSQTIIEDDPELHSIDIIEHLGDTIPLNLEFIDDHGQTVKIGNYFNHDEPVILIMAYYTCPKLCNLVMNGVADAARQLKWIPGNDYTLVTVSIDPTETDLVASAKKQNYLKYLGIEGITDNAWHFLTGKGENSQALADAIGFKYFFVEERQEYAHAAAFYVLTDQGVLSRYFYGIQFEPSQLKLALLEASEGKIGGTFDRLILYCFHYDPDSKGYVLFAQNVMTVGGVLTMIILILVLGGFWLKEIAKRRVSKINMSEN